MSVPKSEEKSGLWYWAVFVGVYGNLMASFFEKIIFPNENNASLIIQIFLYLSWFLSFLFYVLYAYQKKENSITLLLIHAVLPWGIIMNNFFILTISGECYPNLVSDIMFFGLCYTFLIFIYGSETLAFGKWNKRLLRQRWKQKKLRIGILNDMGWDETDEATMAGSDISPTMWKDGFCQKKYQLDLITNDSDFRDFVAIINPYGGVYPEDDLETLDTVNKILQFVEGGGVFVNVADVPTYWAYSKNLKKRIDHTETVYSPEPLKPFRLVPLMKELDLEILNIPSGLTQTPYSFNTERVAVNTDNMEPIIPIIQMKTPNKDRNEIDTASMFFIGYGKGDFLISLMWINVLADNDKTIVRDLIINNLVCKLDQKKGLMLAGD